MASSAAAIWKVAARRDFSRVMRTAPGAFCRSTTADRRRRGSATRSPAAIAAGCQSCHGSQIRVTLDTAMRAYRTGIQSLAVNCESCHGPGAPHLARVRDPNAVASGDLGLRPLATLTKDQSVGTCWQCHALKD